MRELSANDPTLGSAPAEAWIRFLRSYGPTPNDLNLFDEYVTGALHRSKVRPIALASPQFDAMKQRIESGSPGAILIAGTAGDGKTYHCRSLWESFGGSSKEWGRPDPIKDLKLSNGRTAVFVKDLTEISDQTQSDEALGTLERTVLHGDDSTLMIVAANHGQILERLRDLGERQGRVHPLRKPIEDAFLQAGPAPDRLAIFDLSRTARRQSLERGYPGGGRTSGMGEMFRMPMAGGGACLPDLRE